MRVNLRGLEQELAKRKDAPLGAVVDTNIVFAGNYELDRLNTWADKFFDSCRKNQLPIYTNINIRAEFLDLLRKVAIPECLVVFLKTSGDRLPEELKKKLKALETRYRANELAEKPTKFDDSEIKQWRKLMNSMTGLGGTPTWDFFCRDYLFPLIKDEWNNSSNRLGLNFLGSRGIESAELFYSTPNWDGATEVLGLSGMGSFDAMIVNFFQCSKFEILVSADLHVVEYLEEQNPAALIVFPDKIENI